MRTLLHRLRHNERGVSLVFVGGAFLTMMGVSMLAIDVGMLMTARTQAQNAADAGALAGATALMYDDYTDRSQTGPSVQNAIAAARANAVMAEMVSVGPADVTFPEDPQGEPNRVAVSVFRTAARGNPISNLIASLFGFQNTDVTASAIAEVSPANAAREPRPFALPDRWTEVHTPPFDGNDVFTIYKPNGSPHPNPDVYVPVGQPNYTGYDANPTGPDFGSQLVIRTANGHAEGAAAGWACHRGRHFFPIRFPGGSGASWYQQNIVDGWTDVITIGDVLEPEGGAVVQPTRWGVNDLVAQDPNAYWDPVAQKVVSNQNPSPRVIVIPVFDPKFYEDSRVQGIQNNLKIVNLIGLFIEGYQNGVVGRVVPAPGVIRTDSGPVPEGAYARAIRLVQ